MPRRKKPETFQDLILALHEFWKEQGCVIEEPFDVEVGAGTMHPATFLRCLGRRPWKVAYVQPSRRPADGRYGENPNRLHRHHQYQVILKPAPDEVQDIYLQSLEFIGIDTKRHDIRFIEDDWEAPTLGASGVGWEVWLDGLEITQLTYFQTAGGMELEVIPVELTYGLERIAMYLQGVDDYRKIRWSKDLTYGDIHYRWEREASAYNFEVADIPTLFSLFETYQRECLRALEQGLVYPAYDYVLKCSHTFNLLDSRGALSVTERTTMIDRIRELARRCAEAYLKEDHSS